MNQTDKNEYKYHKKIQESVQFANMIPLLRSNLEQKHVKKPVQRVKSQGSRLI